MSEKNNVISSPEKDVTLARENAPVEQHNPIPAYSDESIAVESREPDVLDNRQPAEQNQERSAPLDVLTQCDVKATDSRPEQGPVATSVQGPVATSERGPVATSVQGPVATSVQGPVATSVQGPVATSEQGPVATSEQSLETKSLEKMNYIDQLPIKSAEVCPPMFSPNTEKVFKEINDVIQHIQKEMNDLELNEPEGVIPASGKKGRKPASTPRARSTPIHIQTSPPVTRSRSRDMRKFPSTPASPARKGSDSDADEIKGARGRQRAKKNN